MKIDNCYLIDPEDAEEVRLANAAILEYRKQRQHNELIQKCKMAISFEISDTISKLGLAETKRIVRELARELRDINI